MGHLNSSGVNNKKLRISFGVKGKSSTGIGGRGRDIDITGKLKSPILFWHLRGKRTKRTGAPALATAVDVIFGGNYRMIKNTELMNLTE